MIELCGVASRLRDWSKMPMCLAGATFILTSAASAEDYGRPTAILVSPIHEAQVVRGDDGMDHVEYELLVVSVFPEPVTLSSVIVLDPVGKELMRMDGAALAAATQTLFAKTASPVVPASAAVSIDVDLILPPGAAPERVTHRIAYTLKADSQLGLLADPPEVDAPEVAINHQAAIVIRPPVEGDGWLAGAACCKPNVHRDERIAINGSRIETAETFAVDLVRVRQDRIFDGDGKAVEQYYGFGENVLAVADGTVVSVHDGMSDQTPFVLMTPKSTSDYGGNNVMLEIAPNVFAWYAHLRHAQHRCEGWRRREGRGAHRQIGQHRALRRPPSPFGSSRQAGPDRRAQPAFRFRQLHLGRRGRFRCVKGGSAGHRTAVSPSSVRVSALRRRPESPERGPMSDEPQGHGVCVVVGAGDGLGASIARAFAREGLRVCVTRRPRNTEAVDKLAEVIRAEGGEAYAFGLDARVEDDVAALIERIEREIGPIEVLVFNIGANVRFPIVETTARVYSKVWEMAALAGFLASREVARSMIERGRGTILFTGATASVRGGSGFAAFAGAKHALRALAQSLARELGPKGVHVAHVVIDGAIDGAFIRGLMPDAAEKLKREEILVPDEIAKNYVWLHRQKRSAWTFEMDLRPWSETW